MSKKEALKIVLIDVCCSNGREFCKMCPLSKTDNCGETEYNEKQLLEAAEVLINIIN